MKRIPVGSAHGRFQPLHNDHLEYLIESKKRCDFLWIGITQFNIKQLYDCPVNPHREKPTENPLTYFERADMIKSSLSEEGIKCDEYGIIPFPLGDPDCLSDFLPTSIPIFTTICDEWNIHKIHTLEQNGYEVIVLWERRSEILRGVNIRNMIANDNLAWHDQVPQTTIKLIDRINLKKRLLELRRDMSNCA